MIRCWFSLMPLGRKNSINLPDHNYCLLSPSIRIIICCARRWWWEIFNYFNDFAYSPFQIDGRKLEKNCFLQHDKLSWSLLNPAPNNWTWFQNPHLGRQLFLQFMKTFRFRLIWDDIDRLNIVTCERQSVERGRQSQHHHRLIVHVVKRFYDPLHYRLCLHPKNILFECRRHGESSDCPFCGLVKSWKSN